jgi:hypothetical protein
MIAHKLIAACNAGWLQIAPERDQKPPQYPVRRKNNTKTSIKLRFSTVPTGMSRFAISSNGTAVLA